VAEELSDTSAEFARIWRHYEVGRVQPATDVSFGHPDAGLLLFKPIQLRPELQPDLALVVFLPSSEATATALGRFATHDAIA
jgi:hypothetical protein